VDFHSKGDSFRGFIYGDHREPQRLKPVTVGNLTAGMNAWPDKQFWM
jgi:hypothetical protein